MGRVQDPVPGHPVQRQQPGDQDRHLTGNDHGAGLISSVAGVAIFLTFLLFAVQVVVGLYATSTVTAVGYDAARRVASGDVDHADPGAVAQAEARAEDQARQQLGRFGREISFDWSGSDGGTVRLHVQATVPRTGFGQLVARPIGLDVIDRTLTVRVEKLR